MKQKLNYFLTFSFVFFFSTSNIFGQVGLQKSLFLEAKVQVNPPQITVKWTNWSVNGNFNVYKKEKDASNFSIVASVNSTDSSYTDTAVTVGQAYDYYINQPASGAMSKIHAGIELPVEHNRGTILLVIDKVFAAALPEKINRLKWDLVGDGWLVKTYEVARSATSGVVRNQIKYEAGLDSTIRSVFVIGNVAVPYSGNLYPDGHTNHIGAWPADGFYGDIDGIWSDVNVNNTSSSQSRNHNTPSDGKMDNSSFPSEIELEVGRVDFTRMTTFSESDTALLERYLDKDHQYRHGIVPVIYKALVDDNFKGMSEGFSSSGWRNISSIIGGDAIKDEDYFTTLADSAYVWAYGCGGGSYTSSSGIGNTGNFSTNTVRSVFNMIFGSYFGDWDSDNNFLRAPLASKGNALINAWAGRPMWYFHHMGLGETVGYGARYSMNNTQSGTSGFYPRGVHMGLMGDPSLRMFPVKPVKGLNLSKEGYGIKLQWSSSLDVIDSLYIYHSKDSLSGYRLLETTDGASANFVDTLPTGGWNYYMVRVGKMEHTNSGSFFNLSQGAFARMELDSFDLEIVEVTDTLLCYDQELRVHLGMYGARPDTSNYVFLQISDSSGDFGGSTDLAAVRTPWSGHIFVKIPYTLPVGNKYRIRINSTAPVVVSEPWHERIAIEVCASVEEDDQLQLIWYPNPAEKIIYLDAPSPIEQVQVYNLTGSLIYSEKGSTSSIDIQAWEEGVYFIETWLDGHKKVQKLIVQ